MLALLDRPAPVPRVRHAQSWVTNDAPDAIFLASAYGMAPDDWQDPILHDWLARRADGKFCHGRCGLAVPRQNGKNGVIEIRELFGMIELGEAFLHSAHELKTARKAFKRLKHFFGDKVDDPKALYPELNALVAEVRATNSQEAIFLKDVWRLPDGTKVRSKGRPDGQPNAVLHQRGGSIEVIARSSGSGRGFTVDVLVLDEAQHLDDQQIEAIRSAVSSAPLGDPQVIYAGTPPDREKAQTGLVWHRIRRLAEAKDPRVTWTEYGVPDGPLSEVPVWERGAEPTLGQLQALYAANPSLGLRHANGAHGLGLDVVLDERGDLSDEGIARERFGWWGEPQAAKVGIFGAGKWERLATVRDTLEQLPRVEAIGIGVSLDAKWCTIGSAGLLDGDRILLAVSDRRAGNAWAPAEVKRIQDTYRCAVVIDEKCPDPTLIERLVSKGVRVTVMSLQESAAAVAGVVNGIDEMTVAHLDEPVLNDAVIAAAWRLVGERRLIDQKKATGDVSALLGVVAAHRGADSRINYDVEDSLL